MKHNFWLIKENVNNKVITDNTNRKVSVGTCLVIKALNEFVIIR